MREIRVIEPMIFQDTAKLRVCAYARVSSDSEDQKTLLHPKSTITPNTFKHMMTGPLLIYMQIRG